MTAANLDAISVISLRSPRTFSYEEFRDLVSLLPEAVRCRIYASEGVGMLSTEENLSLIGERLDFVLASWAKSPTTVDSFGPTPPTELELLARDVCQLLKFKPGDEALSSEVIGDLPTLALALRTLEQIVKPSSEGHQLALYANELYALDFLIIPLTLYRTVPDMWLRARQAAEDLCTALASSSGVIRVEVPVYRAFVAEIDAGVASSVARSRMRANLDQCDEVWSERERDRKYPGFFL